MTAYYNEIDPYAAQWLRNLIEAGHIAPGVVDERDIRDIRPDELMGYTQCHFFAGIGVWSYALRRAGWSDERPIWTGSCPCQPFSVGGTGEGFTDERHLWPHFHWLIEQCNPSVVIGEQVASKDGLGWLDLVSSDMEGTGYAFGASDLCAAGFGAAHIRQRLYWIGADSSNIGMQGQSATEGFGEVGQRGPCSPLDLQQVFNSPFSPGRDWPQPLIRKGVDAFAGWVGRMRAYGNALHAETATQFCSAVIDTLGDMAADDGDLCVTLGDDEYDFLFN